MVDREKIVEALQEAIDHLIARNGWNRYAYDRCRICGLTWWGPREGRSDPEPERHNHWCPVPRWRALAAADEPRPETWTSEVIEDGGHLWIEQQDGDRIRLDPGVRLVHTTADLLDEGGETEERLSALEAVSHEPVAIPIGNIMARLEALELKVSTLTPQPEREP